MADSFLTVIFESSCFHGYQALIPRWRRGPWIWMKLSEETETNVGENWDGPYACFFSAHVLGRNWEKTFKEDKWRMKVYETWRYFWKGSLKLVGKGKKFPQVFLVYPSFPVFPLVFRRLYPWLSLHGVLLSPICSRHKNPSFMDSPDLKISTPSLFWWFFVMRTYQLAILS